MDVKLIKEKFKFLYGYEGAVYTSPNRIRVYAIDFAEQDELGLDDIPTKSWGKYILGVGHEMMKRGAKISGLDCVCSADVPLGGAMSSSATLDSCFGFVLNEIYKLVFNRFELAKIGQATKHNYVGLKCGIMLQERFNYSFDEYPIF